MLSAYKTDLKKKTNHTPSFVGFRGSKQFAGCKYVRKYVHLHEKVVQVNKLDKGDRIELLLRTNAVRR